MRPRGFEPLVFRSVGGRRIRWATSARFFDQAAHRQCNLTEEKIMEFSSPPAWRTDAIYRVSGETTVYFVSPDSIGRYFYDSLAEAKEQHGLDIVINVSASVLD